jgi:hypothetical protein
MPLPFAVANRRSHCRAIVVLAGFLFAGMAYYIFGGHKRFRCVAEQGSDVEGFESADADKQEPGQGRVVEV